jgi:hypothetical protein
VNRIWIAMTAFAVLALSGAGCKQGLGDRCEVDADCASGVCAMATPKICVSGNQQTEQIDATLPIDAPTDTAVDAADARPDAP